MSTCIHPISELVNKTFGYYIDIQNSDGGFPYNIKGAPSGAWASSGILWSITCFDVTNHPINNILARLINYLRTNQNNDGLIPCTIKNDMGCVDATAQYIMGSLPNIYIYKMVANKRSVDKAVQGLLNCVQEDGWGTKSTSKPMVASTSFALMALHSAKNIIKNSSNLESIIQSKINVLLNMQNDDGGWSICRYASSEAGTTALATLAISKCLPNILSQKEDIINKAKIFIKQKQLPQGIWEDVIERNLEFAVFRYSTPYCIAALSVANISYSNVEYQKSIIWLLEEFKDGKLQHKASHVDTWSTRDGLIALLYIGDILTKKRLISLLDYGIQVELEKKTLEDSRNLLQNSFDNFKQEEANRVDQKVKQEFNKIRTKFLFFQILFAFVLLVALSLGAVLLYYHLTTEQLLTVIAIEVTVWTAIVGIIFTNGLGKKYE
ncbi:MAG: terpene cyclase/mutase family protein [Fibromonadales bacterium]|nr:terpene cyclase/mutase family protein [Fibromonadales bacterium]